MGVLYDYFSAASDQEAAQVLNWIGGPGCPPPGQAAKDYVATKIEADIQMGKLEALLTGLPYEEIASRPRHTADVGVGGPNQNPDAEQGVMALTDEFAHALATATDRQLAAAAVPWAQIEEIWGYAMPQELEEIMRGLRGLAQRASRQGSRLYCWMSV